MSDYNVRRENLISPWGVGSIIPFPHDESLMVAGLDNWFDEEHPNDDFLFPDERLSKRLGGKLFALPPDFRTKQQDPNHAFYKIPAVRFPLWQYCPVCGNMEKTGGFSPRKHCPGDQRRNKDTYCSKQKDENKRPYMIPERFIAVCECGHIEDFPIMEWVHRNSNKPIEKTCKLYRSTGGSSSSLAGIKYTCTCGASYNMKSAFYKGALDGINYFCTGNRPWLGLNSSENCGKTLTVTQRGASNVWCANVISSIYIPWLPKYTNEATKDCIKRGVNKYKSALVNGEIDKESIRKFAYGNAEFDEDIDAEQVYDEIIETLMNGNGSESELNEDEYRKQEFDVLTCDSGKTSDELYVKNRQASEYSELSFLKSVSLVHKLRETRVFVGFQRINFSFQKTPAISLRPTNWLPAIKNSGEGIMLEFDYAKLHNWAEKESVKKRVNIIEKNLNNSSEGCEGTINPVYILLHTFSHCLITALANESGYSNASIRERIYCSKYLENASEMAGILIYTASGDSEGSLGGLVRQGLPGKIEKIIQHALSEAKWCASDPVCIQSPGQGQSGCNLAACHNCALLPETSCENKNKLLDRGVLIGTLDNPGLGFFANAD